jgi:transcriptional regulator with XRE-family HTH domain
MEQAMPPIPTLRTNGATIRAIRKMRGYPTAELARRAACTPGTLTNIEGGRRRPSVELANRIANALGVDLAAILRD